MNISIFRYESGQKNYTFTLEEECILGTKQRWFSRSGSTNKHQQPAQNLDDDPSSFLVNNLIKVATNSRIFQSIGDHKGSKH